MMRRAAWVWAVAAVLMGVGSAWAAGEAAVLRFDPGDKVTRVFAVKTGQAIEVSGQALPARQNVYQEKQVAARTAKGYAVTSTMLEADTTGGVAQTDAFLSAMKGKALTLSTDRDGKFLTISGLEAVVAELQKSLPAAAAQTVNVPFLTAALKAEWTSSVTDYVGRPAQAGASWVSIEEVALPDGRVAKCYVAKKVAAPVTVGERPYLRVETMSNSDPAQLQKFLGESAAKTLANLKAFPKTTQISGDGYCVLDPLTLTCAEAKTTRRVQGNMKFPGMGELPVTFTETRESKEVPVK
jgi:hypothetical protein